MICEDCKKEIKGVLKEAEKIWGEWEILRHLKKELLGFREGVTENQKNLWEVK